MNLSELSIRRPVFAWMLMAALIVFGALAFNRLGISQLPDVNSPVVSVSVSLPGAAPEVMESQVIDPIEDSIMQIDGIRTVDSNSQQSSGSIKVEFELGRDIDVAVQQIEDRISQVRSLLPAQLYPPSVRKSNPEDQPLLWLTLTSDGSVSLTDLMIYARNTLYDQFGTVPGVGDIALGGYVDPALRVWVDMKRLNQLALTPDDVVNAITNEHVEVPAGRIEAADREFNVRILGEARSPQDFGEIRVNSRSGGPNYKPLRLADIAKVEEGTVDIRRISRSNGKTAVGLGILKQHGSNAVEVARLVREKLAEIRPTIPKQFQLDVRSDSTRFIQQSVHELEFMLLLSAILTSIVCYLFLGSISSTINVLMAIPTSIIGTFIAIRAFGFTLNTYTLLGLSLAIGVVVDDAIMMLENIVRHMELGEKRKKAALLGSKEITFAALAATLAVVAIFLPVVFMKGVIGRYFFQYGVTVSAAVLLSLLEALTLTPMRCSQYLRVSHQTTGLVGATDRAFARLSVVYAKVLGILLNHRWKTLVTACALFAGSLLIAKKLPTEMMPAQDQGQIMLRLKAPVGSALPYTNEKSLAVEKYLQTLPEVSGIFSTVGGFGGDAVAQGNIFVSLVDADKRKKSQKVLINQIRDELKQRVKGIRIIAQDLSLKGFSSGRGFPIEFVVQGPDWDELQDQTSTLIDALEDANLTTDTNSDIDKGVPEVRLLPDRAKLAQHGVAASSVTSAVNSLVGGAILNGTTEYPKAGHRYEIEVRLLASQRDDPKQLEKIQVRNNRGELIPLASVVTQEVKPALTVISRENRFRSIIVYANPAPGKSQQEVLTAVQALAKKTLAPGYYVRMTGNAQSFQESMQSLFFALLLGIVVSYMVLASQFNSFVHPVTVLLALPFSLSGALVGLYAFHQSLNIYSMIGFILLMGIVKKNSILLVDFTNQCRAEGLPVREALIRACPVRLRPILMTSVATIAGALPEALSIGPGAETTIPMAIAIIGGVAASTVLTLFVVPCAYSLITRMEGHDSLEG